MEQNNRLALRFPSPVSVRCQLMDAAGQKLDSFSAQGVDVSRSGVRLEANALPSDLLKKLGNLDAEPRVEMAFETKKGDLPVVGYVRWLKDFPGSKWLIGIEYLPVDIGRGTAISRHFERKYAAPMVFRSSAIAAGIVAVLGAGLVLEANARQTRNVNAARRQLDAALGEKEAITVLLAELDTSLDTLGEKGESRDELVKQIVTLRSELDKAREEVGKRSVRLAAISKPATSENQGVREHVARGDRFFSEGNLSAALLEFEKSLELDPRYAEAWLKSGIIHEFQERPVRALEAYGRYLELRKNAPDWHEVNSRVEHLSRDAASAL